MLEPDGQGVVELETELRPVRFIAVGNRMNLRAAVSEQSFVAELERIVEMAVPHLAQNRPNLVVLGELLGLPLAFTGRRGYLSRLMNTSSVAISTLALSYARRMLHYRRKYPGISLIRSLMLSLTDSMYRPFITTLSQLAARHTIYLSAGTITPHVRRSTSWKDIRRFGTRNERYVYLPDGPGMYNTGFLWGPNGKLLGTADKVFLTEQEKSAFDLTPGELDQMRVFKTPIGNIGIAMGLDAFTPVYLHRLDELEATVVVQNDANDQLWAAPSRTYEWQPQEWLNSVLGLLQSDYPHLLYSICAMQVGNFFDIPFDGQSSIARKCDTLPGPYCNFVGNEGYIHTLTGKPMQGEFLAIAPWAAEEPLKQHPGMQLAERRELLGQVARQLLPGGARANQYPESVIWADVDVPCCSQTT